MKNILLYCVVTAFSLPLYAADNQPNIETLMTAEELRATGVGELSETQIEALNAWLERYRDDEVTAAIAEVPVDTDSTASSNTAQQQPLDVYPPPRERIIIDTRIDGEFNGWTGRTRFVMQNGQVWEQRRGRRWKISLDSPEVRLSQNFLGAWEMEVISEGRSIGVRRIR
ncbi:MAG: hypothetical protein MI746_02935 [Pseudomonadales bacterium]|nr:hypothetical protein [Pseudomonadales bacterium]